MSKIYLSPSNQYANTYSYGKTNEQEQCNRIAEYAEIALKRNGYEVKRAPKGQDMNKSISESNKWGADIHIPIHTNAGNGRGPLVMVHSLAEANLKYAKPVYENLIKIAPKGGGYGVRRDIDLLGFTLAEIKNTKAIAVYIEAEFHDSKDLAEWIIKNVEQIGEAICKGICEADGKAYKEETKTLYRIYKAGKQIGAFATLEFALNMAREELKKGNSVEVEVVNK